MWEIIKCLSLPPPQMSVFNLIFVLLFRKAPSVATGTRKKSVPSCAIRRLKDKWEKLRSAVIRNVFSVHSDAFTPLAFAASLLTLLLCRAKLLSCF